MAAENSSGPAEAGALSRDGGFAGLAYVASSMKASLFLLVRALRFGVKEDAPAPSRPRGAEWDNRHG